MFSCLNCDTVILDERDERDETPTKLKNKEISLNEMISQCNTGDIVLFNSDSIIGKLIKKATESIFTHVGIILRNPSFIKEEKEDIKLYLYNSDGPFTEDVEKEETKSGVQVIDLISKLKNFKGDIFYRKLIYDTDKIKFINEKLEYIHSIHYNTYYDYMPNNWLGAYLSINHYSELSKVFSSPRRLDRMFCSAFVAYIYTQLGILNQDTEWSFVIPSYFADIKQLENNYILDDLTSIII